MKSWLSRHSYFILSVFVVLVIAGTAVLPTLPVSLFPTLEFPRISISLDAGDRPADQMVTEITRPVEEVLRSIPGVHDIRSQTSRGSAEISVTFNWGHDMSIAALQAESEIARLTSSLPAGLIFNVRRMDPTIFPVLGYSITSQKTSLVALKNFAIYELRPLLVSIDGVAEVSVLGGREAEYQVIVDPIRLQALGLSILDVESALNTDNIVTATGRFEDRSRLYLTLVDERLTDINDIGSIVLNSSSNAIVELDDVAEIRLSTAQEWTRVTADGQTAVLLNIRQTPDANSIALTNSVKKVLAKERSRFPSDVVITPYYDQTDLIHSAVSSVRDSILIGTVLAGLVLFIFLRSTRFVMLVAIMLPSVLVSTTLLLSVLGLSLNIMTLGGMAAAVGLIVDDMIVMLEHITRRLNEKSASVLEAASEIARPLVGSSLATIIVFTPLSFLTGVTGGFFKALAVTMAASLIFSMLYALFVVPLLSLKLAKPEDAVKAEQANHWLKLITSFYIGLMRNLLQRARLISIVMLSLAIIIGGLSAKHVASGFMPQMDEGGFVLDYFAPPGLSLTETNNLVEQMESIIRSVPEVESYSRRTGLQLGGSLTEANEGDMFVRLKPLPRRDIESIMAEIRSRVASEVPGLEIETIQLMGDIIGDLTAVPQPIEIKFYGTDPSSLSDASDLGVSILEKIPGVVEVKKSDRISGDAVVISLDRARLALEGLDTTSTAQQIDSLVGGHFAGSILAGEKIINIKVWTSQNIHDRVSALENLQLRSSDGRLLPLKRVGNVNVVSGQVQTSRENLQSMAAVTGRLENRDMGSAMHDVTQAMQNVTLPASVRFEFGGLYVEQQKSFRDLMIVFASALILSSLLLIYLLCSLSHALSIMAVVGLSVSGVIAGLVVTSTELNIAAMMGLTMVIGIVAELGVFYFAELPKGVCNHSQRIEAGVARLRPIFMSALIAILALLPLALQIGQGSALLAPMAIAIISGLLIGAPMVLIAAPIIHCAIQQITSNETHVSTK